MQYPVARRAVQTIVREHQHEAFDANRDPFGGSEIEGEMDRLFSLIVSTVSESIQ
ncbi:hypothetical protein OKW30_000849 [Paraburkholderia sp. Clong3]|uniref:hypothetical protein n=1 Tax=Paraburkholderia sp. Clong3 TaxID=2991061 RepID=UPI003D1E2B11